VPIGLDAGYLNLGGQAVANRPPHGLPGPITFFDIVRFIDFVEQLRDVGVGFTHLGQYRLCDLYEFGIGHGHNVGIGHHRLVQWKNIAEDVVGSQKDRLCINARLFSFHLAIR